MKNLFFTLFFQIGVNVIGIPEIHWHNLTDRKYSLEKPKSKFHSQMKIKGSTWYGGDIIEFKLFPKLKQFN